MTQRDPPRATNLPAGYDESDPYEDEDLSTYPEWWRRNIEEFREYEMRPYRPPRFSDDTLTPEVIQDLESKYEVNIEICKMDQHADEGWDLFVDGDLVTTLERHRVSKGYTRYEITQDEFRERIQNTVESQF